jgi:hypothetical protein
LRIGDKVCLYEEENRDSWIYTIEGFFHISSPISPKSPYMLVISLNKSSTRSKLVMSLIVGLSRKGEFFSE